MKKKLGILSIGIGNINSVVNSFEQLNIKIIKINNPRLLEKIDCLVIPGVGSFGSYMKTLREKKFINSLNYFALEKKKPILGICLGLHLFLESSEEEASVKGLGWIKGTAEKLKKVNQKTLNVGWSRINKIESLKIPFDNYFYFDHSYTVKVNRKYILSRVVERNIPAVVHKNNLIATQFHPEKSSLSGSSFFNNFLKFYKIIE